MNHLSKNVEVLYCLNCQQNHTVDEREEDAYDGSYCPNCGVEGHIEHTGTYKDFEFWSVALYDVGQGYGGPEEGGWYYSIGVIIMPAKVRVFEDYDEAAKYVVKLHKEFDDLKALGFSGELPPEGWPSIKPRYC